MTLTKKVMILFDPDKYEKVALKAKIHKKSVSALIRDIIDETILSEDNISKEKRIEAAKRIVCAEEEPIDWKEIEKLIAQGHIK